MNRNLFLALTMCCLWAPAQSQNLPPKLAYPLSVKQIHCGHSLTDPLFHPWPGQYRFLIYDVLGGNFDHVGKSTIPGSSLRYRWENAPQWGQPWARQDIPNWELLCITESVPLHYAGGGNAPWYLERLNEQRHYLSLFVNNAWLNGNNGAGAPTLLWTTWTNIDNADGPWRPLLDVYEGEWEAMQDYANAQRPQGAPPVYLIPGHRMMARLYDDIAQGIVPDATSIADFFSDNIHVNSLGSYAVAMMHYACIYNASPVGLPANLLNGGPGAPSEALAAYLQNMVWEVATTYPRTGILSSAATTPNASVAEFDFSPNPAKDRIAVRILAKHAERPNPEIRIFNTMGQLAYSGGDTDIDLSSLPGGLYYIAVGNAVRKLIKQD